MKAEILERSAILFSALSHPVRIQMVTCVADEPKSVNDIAAELGIAQSRTSQHLAILTRAGVLTVKQRGTSRLYTVRGPRIPSIVALIEEFCTVHSLYGTTEIPLDIPIDDDALATASR